MNGPRLPCDLQLERRGQASAPDGEDPARIIGRRHGDQHGIAGSDIRRHQVRQLDDSSETANSVGGQLSEAQVISLPIGNSDYTRLALTLPGATQNSNFAFAQYTINGSRSRSNAFFVDGASNTDPSTYLPSLNEGGNSATAATRLPLDAIQEVSVVAAAAPTPARMPAA